jgi:shikimate kinase
LIEHKKLLKNNYFFCGIKHSGKTTHAKIFAKNHNLSIFDGDDLILKSLNGQSIRSFYREFGKDAFMKEELASILSFISEKKDNRVLSLGGGICDNKKAIELLKDNGLIIFIRVDELTLYNRIIKDGIPPFLEGNPKEKFHILFNERDTKYLSFCDIVIEVQDAPIDETADIIDAEINKRIKNGT